MKAVLLYYAKYEVEERYLVEIEIHEVVDRAQYKDGVKYGLFFMDLVTQRRILMDNHHPKGHHVHVNDAEFEYAFVDVQTLIRDFRQLIANQAGVSL